MEVAFSLNPGRHKLTSRYMYDRLYRLVGASTSPFSHDIILRPPTNFQDTFIRFFTEVKTDVRFSGDVPNSIFCPEVGIVDGFRVDGSLGHVYTFRNYTGAFWILETHHPMVQPFDLEVPKHLETPVPFGTKQEDDDLVAKPVTKPRRPATGRKKKPVTN